MNFKFCSFFSRSSRQVYDFHGNLCEQTMRSLFSLLLLLSLLCVNHYYRFGIQAVVEHKLLFKISSTNAWGFSSTQCTAHIEFSGYGFYKRFFLFLSVLCSKSGNGVTLLFFFFCFKRPNRIYSVW